MTENDALFSGSNIIRLFERAEKENIKLTKTRCSKELNKYTAIFSLICEAYETVVKHLAKIAPEKRKRKHSAMVVLLPRLVWASKAFLTLITRGYYYEAAIVYRTRLEGIALFACFARDEERAWKWLKEGRIEGISKFQLLKELGAFFEHELLSLDSNVVRIINKTVNDWKRTYGILSSFVHSDRSALRTLIEIEKRPHEFAVISFPILPEFREAEAKEALGSTLDALLLVMLLLKFPTTISPKLAIGLLRELQIDARAFGAKRK